jgi:hypothetical protein
VPRLRSIWISESSALWSLGQLLGQLARRHGCEFWEGVRSGLAGSASVRESLRQPASECLLPHLIAPPIAPLRAAAPLASRVPARSFEPYASMLSKSPGSRSYRDRRPHSPSTSRSSRLLPAGGISDSGTGPTT